MTRFLTAACVVLAVLCALEGVALRRLRADLASVESRARHAALEDLQGRRDEVLRALAWLDAAGRSAPATGQPAGLCKEGTVDLKTIGNSLFDLYLLERAKGKSEVEARQRTLDAMRQAAK
jgi:hypothetical protein